ncbi:MAG: hypothetical protein ACREBN_06215 [Burkholderiaceae bacterium]
MAPGTNRKATTKSIGLLTRGGLVALSLVCWAFVLNVGGSARAPVRHPGAGATVPAPALDASYVRATRRLEQFALNVLVFPLIDDTEPPRWTRHGVDWICDGRGEVAIDGRPLVEGELIPIGQFTIHWALQRCAPFSSDPFGNADLIVEGVVELVVSHDGSSLHGRIAAPSLWIETPTGRRRLSAVNDAGDGVVQALTEIAR